MSRLPYASAADRQAADAFFQKRGTARTLFEALQRTVSAIGRHQLTATRSRVAFVARTKFLWVHEANDDGSIWIGFLLPHELVHVRVRCARVSASRFSIHTKVRGIEDMDALLVGWVEEAYAFDMKGPARPKPGAKPVKAAKPKKAAKRTATKTAKKAAKGKPAKASRKPAKTPAKKAKKAVRKAK